MDEIVLCGPPRSGKSCLREGLKQAVRRIPGVPYPYVITGCPDGEGAWFQETVDLDPELAAKLKAAYKSKFTPEFVWRVADSVTNCKLPLALVDVGGVTSSENKAICANASHAILLAGDPNRLPEWRSFCAAEGWVVIPARHGFGARAFYKRPLTVIAEIFSDYHGKEDAVPALGADGIWRGSVHHLERGETIHERPTVKALAEILVQMASDKNQ